MLIIPGAAGFRLISSGGLRGGRERLSGKCQYPLGQVWINKPIRGKLIHHFVRLLHGRPGYRLPIRVGQWENRRELRELEREREIKRERERERKLGREGEGEMEIERKGIDSVFTVFFHTPVSDCASIILPYTQSREILKELRNV